MELTTSVLLNRDGADAYTGICPQVRLQRQLTEIPDFDTFMMGFLKCKIYASPSFQSFCAVESHKVLAL